MLNGQRTQKQRFKAQQQRLKGKHRTLLDSWVDNVLGILQKLQWITFLKPF